MSKRNQVRYARARAAGGTSGTGRKVLWAGALVAAVTVALITTRDAGAAHPEPREIDHAGHVEDHARYAAHPRVAEVYRQAAAVPGVLDGIYCYCACSQHSGHYSLLDCFASDHGARCDICLSEAALAHRMTRDGASLDEIRAAVDKLYRT